MINAIRLILIFLSLSMYISTGNPNTGAKIFNELDSNTLTLPSQASTIFNPFGKSEFFLTAPVDTAAGKTTTWTADPNAGYTTGYYTIFVGFTVIDQDNANFDNFSLVVKCNAGATTLVSVVGKTDFLVQDVDIASFNQGGAPELKRKDYLKTITFPNGGTCATTAGDLSIILTINQVGTGTIYFYIKQLALFVNLCHPTCEVCPASLSGLTCDTCAASFTLQGDNTCLCTRTPPTSGVVTLNPLSNTNNFRYYCQTVEETIDLLCSDWDSSSKLPFDYCKTCSGHSLVAQYFAPPLSYSASGTINNVNPAVSQTLCDCPSGTTLHFYHSNFNCWTATQWSCLSSGYAKELDTSNVYTYLANMSQNLSIQLTSVTDAVLGDAYKMTFTVKSVITPANLLNFKVYYTYKGTKVLLHIEQVLNQEYYLKIKVSNLPEIDECSDETISVTAKLWRCNIKIVAYHPCNDLAYMDAYIPIQIGEGTVTNGATDAITAHFEATELDIPCVQSNECFINSAFTTSLYHCIDQTCANARVLPYNNGNIVWVRPDLTPAAGDTHTYKMILEYGSFYFYDGSNKLVSIINVLKKANAGLSGNNKSVWGFPIEITGEVENSGVLATGHVALTLTFKLEVLTSRRILQKSGKYGITSPVSLTINIDDSKTNTIFVSALIDFLTLLGAAIIGIVIYCLLRKKKIEETKPQEVKVVETDAAILCTGRNQKRNAEEQR